MTTSTSLYSWAGIKSLIFWTSKYPNCGVVPCTQYQPKRYVCVPRVVYTVSALTCQKWTHSKWNKLKNVILEYASTVPDTRRNRVNAVCGLWIATKWYWKRECHDCAKKIYAFDIKHLFNYRGGANLIRTFVYYQRAWQSNTHGKGGIHTLIIAGYWVEALLLKVEILRESPIRLQIRITLVFGMRSKGLARPAVDFRDGNEAQQECQQ